MKLSIWPSPQQSWPDLLEVVRYADESSWYGAYVWDHFMGDGAGFGDETVPTLESTAVLSALAATTATLRIGSLVLGNTYRHPAVVANWAASVDRISNGRFILGLGAGWQANEHAQYGIELPGAGVRRRRFAEACQVVNMLLTEKRSTFEGTYYQLDQALCEPKPVQEKLPLLIGAKGDRMMGVVARYADRWNMWSLPEQMVERSAVLDRECAKIGRDPTEISRSTQALVFITEDSAEARRLVDSVAPRACVAGPPSEFARTAAAWSEAGVDEVIIPDMTLGTGHQRLESLELLREAVSSLSD